MGHDCPYPQWTCSRVPPVAWTHRAIFCKRVMVFHGSQRIAFVFGGGRRFKRGHAIPHPRFEDRKEDIRGFSWWGGHLEFAHTPDGKMSLRYLRVFERVCSIPKGGASCRTKFMEKFALPLATAPKCTGYEGEKPVPPEEEQTPSRYLPGCGGSVSTTFH
jgi:hypothetical protein